MTNILIFKKICDQKYENSKDLFANVLLYEEINKPFKIDELNILLQQYGINKEVHTEHL